MEPTLPAQDSSKGLRAPLKRSVLAKVATESQVLPPTRAIGT